MNSHCFQPHRSYSVSFYLSKVGEIFWDLNTKRPYLILEKESFCAAFAYSIKRAREIRKFHVAVLKRRLRNVQKGVLHVQGCCFAYLSLLPFCCSCCCHPRHCLSSLLLWSRKFATMVTWCHSSPCSAHFRRGQEEKIGNATSLRTVIKATWSSNPKKEKPSCGIIIFLTKKRVNMCHLLQNNEQYHRIKKQSVTLFKYSATGMFFVAILSPHVRDSGIRKIFACGILNPGNYC